ncbi:uncharacterized protein LOC106165604 [Lingula anatina]|uniref:Uncharacterized protein LOC106165604 n=1 Tax=Lingula anatina TaxID=7574 RepID=A0A1S3IM44_LINAN|nr:uncharacterized protein LOC106165604 [Lingula anatina]|eukprot:XP_013399310.1 uncharacterized protein LOC106165604 [Lingula anatina]
MSAIPSSRHSLKLSMPRYGSLQKATGNSWDINDGVLPVPVQVDIFEEWPDGHTHRIYTGTQEEASRHASGWAMRNTNNHNVNILKKSCLGVLVCSENCTLENGKKVLLRPAICDKARRKQLGRPCPNVSCRGVLTLKACHGHAGYPVTHFWRHSSGLIYFQGKGQHDHAKPQTKASTDLQLRRTWLRVARRRASGTNWNVNRSSMPTPPKVPRPVHLGKDAVCSCPPFECQCSKPGFPSTYTSREPLNLVMESFKMEKTMQHTKGILGKAESSAILASQSAVANSITVASSLSSSLSSSAFLAESNARFETNAYKDCMFPLNRCPTSETTTVAKSSTSPTNSSYDVHGAWSTWPLSLNPDFHYDSTHLDWNKLMPDQYDFEINEPGDILSLDQPLDKNLVHNMAQKLPTASPTPASPKGEAERTPPASDVNPDPNLPSIDYFLAEQQKAKSDAAANASTEENMINQSPRTESHHNPRSASSPKTLTELNPIPASDMQHWLSKGSWTQPETSPPSEVRTTTPTHTSSEARSAFQPYSTLYLQTLYNQSRAVPPDQRCFHGSNLTESCPPPMSDVEAYQCAIGAYPCLPNHSINITLTYNQGGNWQSPKGPVSPEKSLLGFAR